MNTDALAQVRAVIADALLMDPAELPTPLEQKTCARWTSLYHLTIIIALEERFSTSFTTEEIIAMTGEDAIMHALEQRDIPNASESPAAKSA